MPSLVVDGLLCLLLLCGAYILFGRQSASAESQKKTTKKKKRSKASKTAKAQDETTDAAAQVPKASAEGSSARPVSRAVDGTTRQNGHEQQPATTQSRKGERSTQSNSALVKNDGQEEDFPPLSSSRDAVHANTAKQIPLAERLAKTHPKTAVDDMVEKDDALQGKKVYSRTMRIVKPQESKPLLLDNSTNDDDEWENTGQESLKESAWQSVPLSTKSTSSARNYTPYMLFLWSTELCPLPCQRHQIADS